MFKNPSFLFDILCTAAWIVLTVRYARKGFLASMVQLLGNGLSLLGPISFRPPVRAGYSSTCWPVVSAPRSRPAWPQAAWWT